MLRNILLNDRWFMYILFPFSFISFVILSYLSKEINTNNLSLVLILITYLLYKLIKTKNNNIILKNELSNKIHLEQTDMGAYLKFNKNFNITYISKELIDILGDCEGNLIKLLTNCSNEPKKIEKLKSSIEQGKSFSTMVEFNSAKTSLFLDIFVYRLGHTSVKGVEYIMICNDITSHIKTQEELKNQLLKDQLTKLPTRLKLLDDMEKLERKRYSHAWTLINIQIDNYEEINEFFGIDTGYELLKNISSWLNENLPTKNSTLYKFEHNNFAIFTTSRISLTLLEKYLKDLTNKINKKHFSINDATYDISATIGVSRGKKELLKYAYLALKNAQKSNKSYAIYNKKSLQDEKYLNHIKQNAQIKDALSEDRIIPFFQPILNLSTNKIEKFESLMRLQKKDNSFQKPNDFLEIAKMGKLYPELTKMMVSNSIKRLKILQKPITINVGIEDIVNPKISSFIINQLKKCEFSNLITFEILETDGIENYKKVTSFIKKVKAFECKIALDDFGSGYSNFEQILKLDIDYIKIDGSLIKNIHTNLQSEIVTKTIISFAKELGIKTVAEFVWNEEILKKVKSLGIDYAQGYFIGKPAPITIKK